MKRRQKKSEAVYQHKPPTGVFSSYCFILSHGNAHTAKGPCPSRQRQIGTNQTTPSNQGQAPYDDAPTNPNLANMIYALQRWHVPQNICSSSTRAAATKARHELSAYPAPTRVRLQSFPVGVLSTTLSTTTVCLILKTRCSIQTRCMYI